MIRSFIFSDGKLVGSDLEREALRLVRADKGLLLWVDLDNPTEEEWKFVLETVFQFHPLAIEDCVTPSSLPKIEDYEDYLFMVTHAVDYTRQDKFATTELDLFLGKEFIVTFHRQPLKPVQAALDRYLKSPGTGVRGPVRFAHVILDLMVEAYKPALDELHRELDEIESGVLQQMSADELFPRVAGLRKEFSALRQIVRPQREIAAVLTQGKNRFIRPLIVPYLRDLAEELGRIEAQAGAWAEQLILTFRVYLNKSGHEANLGIRVLTGLTAITLPVIIIGGWYGMNFDRMHETEAPYSYFIALALMLTGTVGMLFFLRSKKWL